MDELEIQRNEMVERQVAARGIRDPRVLAAMKRVPRELFIPSHLREFAYGDSPLPIGQEQTISQPYIVALMADALELGPEDRVLEIGTGSGYAAAVLSELAGEVYTIERYPELAEQAAERLAAAGYDNVEVRCADGTEGWPEAAPFDAITVAAGGPDVPQALRDQLALEGRLVIPVGPTRTLQRLLRLRRQLDGRLREESLGHVRFVPLVGAQGWSQRAPETLRAPQLPAQIAAAARPITSIVDDPVEDILERIGDARVVLLGEATHGTSEFYRMRARITRALIERRGFDIVAVEADWPDAARIDEYVRHLERPLAEWKAFARFPTWMWRNEEVHAFADWLRDHNAGREAGDRVRFAGLDLYSMYSSIDRVLEYLDERDPPSAAVARERYGCLTPWQSDPMVYGRAALTGEYAGCEDQVVAILRDLLDRQIGVSARMDEAFHDALQNARLVVDAERYYRAMYYGSAASWNLRDHHMFATLQTVLDFRGPASRAVVWEHNSHIGDASATEMSARGEINVGHLCRNHYGRDAYAIGFGTHAGTVAAAPRWGAPMEVMEVEPSREDSYERLCHDSGVPAFTLPLRGGGDLLERLAQQRRERAIGVIYRPESELASHYFAAILPAQFDEYIWFDRTRAITPLRARERHRGLPDTYPFGL